MIDNTATWCKLPKLVLVLAYCTPGLSALIKGKALQFYVSFSTAWHYSSSVPMMKMSCLFQARLPPAAVNFLEKLSFKDFSPLENFALP